MRLCAPSLNYRGNLVVTGMFSAPEGAGEVIGLRSGVTEFTPRDSVVSTFHPKRFAGHLGPNNSTINRGP